MKIVDRLSSTFVCIVLTLTLQSCSSVPKGKTVSEEMYEVLEQQKAKEIPEFVTQAVLDAENKARPRSELLNTRFDVSVNKIPAKSFFLSLISDVGVNVVTHPNVSGLISLQLKNVSVDEVLNVVRDVYGYEYAFSNNIYTVYPAELRTEIFPINYIDVKRVGVSDTSVSIGEITSSSSDSQGGGSQGGQGTSSQSSNILSMAGDGQEGGSGQGITPGSRVQTLNNTDFWSLLKTTVSSIIGEGKEGRMVVVNPQSGLIVITAMPNEIGTVRKFLASAELSVQRQVILETQILEVRLSEGFEAGVDWSSIQGQLNYSNATTSTNTYNPLRSTVKEGVESFSSVFNVLDIRDLLSLLETQGSVQVLSSPRVSTVNNQKALIRVGTDEFFVTGLSNTTTSNASGGSTSNPEVELSSFFSGISLDVTPQISEEGDVILHVHPIISEVSDQIKELDMGDSKVSLPLAVRDVRESDSIVRVSSGQVVVLGGLMQKSSSKRDDRQPWLSKIPGLNAFFTYKNHESVKTELVILMRPIVVEDDTWDKQISNLKSFSDDIGSQYRSR